jgi:hypothetical protein
VGSCPACGVVKKDSALILADGLTPASGLAVPATKTKYK